VSPVAVDARVAKQLPQRLSANAEQLLAGDIGVSSPHVLSPCHTPPAPTLSRSCSPTHLACTCTAQYRPRSSVLALVRHREAQRGATKSCTLSTPARCVFAQKIWQPMTSPIGFVDLYLSLICVLFRQNGDFMRFVVHPREICLFTLMY
jgi:hypothetical protein